GSVSVDVGDKSLRKRGITAIAEEVRQRLAGVPGAKIQVNVSGAEGAGQPVSEIIQGPDSTVLNSLAGQLEESFQGIAGLRDITTPSQINRRARHRQVPVAANLGDGVVQSQVTPAVQQAVNRLALPPGYTTLQGGSAQQQAQSFGQLGTALVISILLAYLLMAILYNSL